MKTFNTNTIKLLAFGLLVSSTLIAVVAAQNAKLPTLNPATAKALDGFQGPTNQDTYTQEWSKSKP